ncbi:MAG: Gfo/Idh/MocA family oxidoreductase, partial [Acidobacteria bacterium]|nr:Gfo/Idh/MocA family oxidoreductase [Acidobacteriota bacterium]
KSKDHVPGIRVVAAFKGGSPDLKDSAGRVDNFTKLIQEKFGVEIVGTIEALVAKVDVVLLHSLDGRVHLDQVKPVFAAKKRVFIDKPLTASTKDARELVRLSKESGTPFFSASARRYSDTVVKLKENPEIGKILGCSVHSSAYAVAHHPELAFYAIHGIEALFALMGPGFESLRRWDDVVVAQWKDGRVATYRPLKKGASTFGATVYGEKAVKHHVPEEKTGSTYANLVKEIAKFFQTGVSPVSPEEMVEVMAFIEAADVSKAKGGERVRAEDLR